LLFHSYVQILSYLILMLSVLSITPNLKPILSM